MKVCLTGRAVRRPLFGLRGSVTEHAVQAAGHLQEVVEMARRAKTKASNATSADDCFQAMHEAAQAKFLGNRAMAHDAQTDSTWQTHSAGVAAKAKQAREALQLEEGYNAAKSALNDAYQAVNRCLEDLAEGRLRGRLETTAETEADTTVRVGSRRGTVEF